MNKNMGLNMNEVKDVERGLARRIERSLTGIEVEKAIVFTRSWDEREVSGKVYPVIPKVILKLKGKNGKPGKTLIISGEGKLVKQDGRIHTRLQFDMKEPKPGNQPKKNVKALKAGCDCGSFCQNKPLGSLGIGYSRPFGYTVRHNVPMLLNRARNRIYP